VLFLGRAVLVETPLRRTTNIEGGVSDFSAYGKKATPLPHWEVRPSRPSTSISRSALTTWDLALGGGIVHDVFATFDAVWTRETRLSSPPHQLYSNPALKFAGVVLCKTRTPINDNDSIIAILKRKSD
jgi:hypothetical protein